MKIFYIDLFSGAGGTTTGVHMAGEEVVACVNHDANAIESHKANHPECLHLTEDIRDFKVVLALKKLVKQLRKEYPGCVINIWASLECTNYSKAKGGLPRDADSRTLAEDMYMYLEHLDPDYFYVENVREFMSWGPLDENGKPVSRLKGRDYIKWMQHIESMGYAYDYRILNSADFAAYTSRERYFGQFAKEGLPIRWPEPTHAKDPSKGGMFQQLEKWKPVREVLDMEDEGQSIFTRKKPLVDPTLERIYAGCIKFVAGGKESYILKYNSMNRNRRYKAPDIDDPCPVISTQGRLGVVNCAFIEKAFSGPPNDKVISIDAPSGTITTKDHHRIINPVFLSHYYGNGFNTSPDEPCPTIRTKDSVLKIDPQFLTHYYSGGGMVSNLNDPAPTVTGIPKARLTSCEFIDQQYGNSKPSSLENPAGTITANPKLNIVHTSWLLNPQYSSKGGSIESPCFTLIARMDKQPPYLMQVIETGKVVIIIHKDDTPIMRKIKEFMALYGIVDIKMRMLKIPELLRIQGFPEGYELKGTQTEQKKYIGNAVVTHMAKAIILTNARTLREWKEAVAV